MSSKIKLDIISDVVCPWCIIGYKHLEAAIEELGIQDKVEIEWQPFELNPDMPAAGEHLRAHVARKYGASKADSDSARKNIAQHGADYGFTFDYFEEMKIVNTLNAHKLLDFAKHIGKQTQFQLRLFSAFFTEHKDISEPQVLIEEAMAVGITREQAETVLADDSISDRVKALASKWQQMGVSSVPTVVINGTSALSGAQPQETFKQVFAELLNITIED